MENNTFSTKMKRYFNLILAELNKLKELPLFGLFLFCLALAALFSLAITVLFSVLPLAILFFAGLLVFKVLSHWFSPDTEVVTASEQSEMDSSAQATAKLLK